MDPDKTETDRFSRKLARLYKTEEWKELKEFFMLEIIENAGIPDNHKFINGMKHIINLPQEKYEEEINKLEKE